MSEWHDFDVTKIPLDFYLNPRYEIETQIPNGTWIYSYYTHLESREDIENGKDKFRYRLSEEVPTHTQAINFWWDMSEETEDTVWVQFTGYIPDQKLYLYMSEEGIMSVYITELIEKHCVVYPPERRKRIKR